jgi:hypothetical protein
MFSTEFLSTFAAEAGAPRHLACWYAGWFLLLAGFVSGAAMGMRFHREDFLGGYASLRRRLVRLGHIALAVIGLINVVYSLSPWPVSGNWQARGAAAGLIVGGVTMPAVCFLSAWRISWRSLFVIPVAALLAGVACILLGGQ